MVLKNYKNIVYKVRTKTSIVIVCVLMYSLNLIAQNNKHPRIYITNQDKEAFLSKLEDVEWKKKLVDKKKNNLAQYLELCKENPEWLVSRLQMNWKTKHSKVFLKGGNFAYSNGNAPVPTVRFSGTRDWATDYKRPKLINVEPYFDDPKGLYLEHKKTGEKEWVHPSKSGFVIDKINEEIMQLAADAAFLFWFTGEQKYAEFAAPVFLKYMDGMHHRDAPIDLKKSNQQNISGLATFEVIHEGIVVSLVTIYDFLYNYFKANNFSLDNSVSVFQKWGDQIIEKGIPDNNWNLFQARFLTYIALVLEPNSTYKNGKGQEYFLDHTFNISTDRQISIKESLLVYDQQTAIWPESASYSAHVITTLLKIFTLLDHVTNANEFSNYPIVEKAVLASFQYLFPSGYTVGFGDSHHKILPPENLELLITNYRKYNLKEKEILLSGLLSQTIDNKLYTREAKGLFELFFYVDKLNNNSKGKVSIESLTTPTFYAPNVSMLNQRMGKGNNAVMLSTVGSFGNHAHANGISLELYANNYVLGPDLGRGPSYWHPTHRNFYSKFPAHNTVIVDGKSDYSAMRTYHPFKLDNVFPKPGQETAFNKITFSKVSFLEPKTTSDQQRFSAIIKSNTHKAYIVDVFRSKKQKEDKQKHEYLYHNIGQSLDIYDENNNILELTKTDDLSSKKGDLKGYDFFTDKKKIESSKAIKALFRLKTKDNPDQLMKLWVKGSENQSIYSVKSPKSNALTKGTAPAGIIDEQLPTLVLKRNEASWKNPFAVVFNPYTEGGENPIENVSFSSFIECPSTQVIDVTLNDKITNDRIVINASENEVASNKTFYQKGLLSIVRKSKLKKEVDLFFLSGMNKFEYNDWDIVSSGEPFTCSLEKNKKGFIIQNDKPITINMPKPKEGKEVKLELYENGKLISTRKATTNRNNPNKVVFKLSKGYHKALLVITDANAEKRHSKVSVITKEVIYKTIDTTKLKMQFFYPEAYKKKKKYPAIVFFFGGGWNGGSMSQFEDQAKYFASRGMISVLADYRVNKRHKTTPFEAVIDAKSAIRYLRTHANKLSIDKNKIVASGGSAGGHLAAATALINGLEEAEEDLSISAKANALVLYNPVVDNSEKGYGYDRIGDRYLEISPLHNIKKGAPPTIFFLGSKDVIIPVSTAEAYKAKMEAVGSRCDVFIYENQPHGFFNKWKKDGEEHYLKTTQEADLFLQSIGYLKGKSTL